MHYHGNLDFAHRSDPQFDESSQGGASYGRKGATGLNPPGVENLYFLLVPVEVVFMHEGREIREPHFPAESWISGGGDRLPNQSPLAI